MRLWDVTLWVSAFRADSLLHAKTRALLLDAFDRREPFLFCPSLASYFLRLVTNPLICVQASEWREALGFIDWLEKHPASQFVEFDAMAHGIFRHLCLMEGATANSVPDAFLAALAIRHNATLVTADAAMKKWKGTDVEMLGNSIPKAVAGGRPVFHAYFKEEKRT